MGRNGGGGMKKQEWRETERRRTEGEEEWDNSKSEDASQSDESTQDERDGAEGDHKEGEWEGYKQKGGPAREPRAVTSTRPWAPPSLPEILAFGLPYHPTPFVWYVCAYYPFLPLV